MSSEPLNDGMIFVVTYSLTDEQPETAHFTTLAKAMDHIDDHLATLFREERDFELLELKTTLTIEQVQ